MRWSGYRPSKKAVFAWLMILSALAMLLPPNVTDSAKHGTQLLVALQDVAYFVTHFAARSGTRIGDPQHDDRLAHDSLIRRIAAQEGLIEQLRDETRRLGALRDKRISQALHARIVGRDIAAARSSILIERGAELGVHRADYVTSCLFIDQGHVNAVQVGQAVIAREALLGRIEQVSPYMSRVRLFTDIDAPPIEVRVGRLNEDGFAFVDYPCNLRGLGRGRMVIRDVDYRYVQNGNTEDDSDATMRMQVGDLVCCTAGRLGLPEPLAIGRVTAIEEDPKRRLVYDVIIEPAIPLDEIRHVYVIPLIPTGMVME
ncbi:MAG: rod shape-determining protein MreC [Phycisphaerae bacterium]